VVSAAEKIGCEILAPAGVPEVFRVAAGDRQALENVARQAGLCFQPDAPLAILSQLPPCNPPSPGQGHSEFPLGADWRIRGFDARTLQWYKTDRDQAQESRTGFFEFQLYQQWRYFLRWSGGTFELPRGVGLYVLLHRHRKHVLHYDLTTRTLSLPRICRPPRLLERALVLCSGLPPDPADKRLTYSDVAPEVARFAAQLLRQPLA
jgi:hypothetical protein